MWNTTGRVLAAKYEAWHVESEDISKLVVSRVPTTPLKVLEIIQLLKNPPPPPPQEDGVSTLSPAKPKAGEIYIHKNLNSANGNTTANAWCVKGLALTCLFSISIWVTNT